MDGDKNYKIYNEEIEFKLKEISEWIGMQLPPGWGFSLLISSFGKDSQLFYMSNIKREDMLTMMEKFVELQRKEKPQAEPPALPE